MCFCHKKVRCTRQLLEAMDMLIILMGVMVSWVCAHPQTHQTVYIRYVQFFVYQLDLSKAVLKIHDTCRNE